MNKEIYMYGVYASLLLSLIGASKDVSDIVKTDLTMDNFKQKSLFKNMQFLICDS